jgi:3-hydroxyisobutyrate dehydrogenase
MAKNLRAKIQESDTMVIHDVNAKALEKFKSEVGNVEVAKNVREVAEKTVCVPARRSGISASKMNPYNPIFMI